MRAVVVATGHRPGLQGFAMHEPSVLLPVAARPFLHFVVEFLVDSGVSQIDFILSEMPEKVEDSLGDGTRWGVKFRYHLARDAARPYGRLGAVGIGQDETVVLAHGDRLPLCNLGASPQLVYHKGEWTGWGILGGAGFSLPTVAGIDDLDEQGFAALLASRVDLPPQQSDLLLSVRTFEDLLEANWAVLEKKFPKLMLAGREAGEGIWICRNVSLHPTARLTPPVYIGENCRINAAVQLGPRVVIANNCLVDQSSAITETVVFAGSYIGEALELKQAIVDRNRLVNIKVGAAITVTDNFILGSFVERNLQHLAQRTISRIMAGLLAVLTSPLLLLAWLFAKLASSGPALPKTVVRLPVAHEPEYETYRLMSLCGSKHATGCTGGAHQFFWHFLPGLINVARGHLSLAGVAPRTVEEIEALPRDWKQLYLGSKAGLITEAYVVHGAAPPEDLLYSAEVFYAAMAGPKHDARLMAAYVARILGLKRRAEPLETEDNLTP